MLITESKKNKGFTLVEMMVAIAVFSTVMVTAVSALLNVIDANNKARGIKSAINNVTFALEGLSKDMRTGTDYACGNGTEPDGDCLTGGNVIKYKSPKAKGEGWAYFSYDKTGENPKLMSCLDTDTSTCGLNNGPWQAVTSSEVKITNAVFYVIGTDGSHNPAGGDRTQPRLIITVSGEAGSKDKIKTSFDLQTTVSQIIRASN